MSEQLSQPTVIGFKPETGKLLVEFSNPFGGEKQSRQITPISTANGDIDDQATMVIVEQLARGITYKMSLASSQLNEQPMTSFTIIAPEEPTSEDPASPSEPV